MTEDLVTLPLSVPRSALTIVAAPADTISQRTAEAVTGLPRRNYLEQLNAYKAAGGVVASVGKLRIVERAPFVRWLMSREIGTRAVPISEPVDRADALAAELGLRVVNGGRS